MFANKLRALAAMLFLAIFTLPSQAEKMKHTPESDAALQSLCGYIDSLSAPRIEKIQVVVNEKPQFSDAILSYMRTYHPFTQELSDLAVLRLAGEEFDYASDSLAKFTYEIGYYFKVGLAANIEIQQILIDKCLESTDPVDLAMVENYFGKNFLPLENKLRQLTSALEEKAFYGGTLAPVASIGAELGVSKAFTELLFNIVMGKQPDKAFGKISDKTYSKLAEIGKYMDNCKPSDIANLHEFPGFSEEYKKLPAEIAEALLFFKEQTLNAFAKVRINTSHNRSGASDSFADELYNLVSYDVNEL